MLAVVVCGALFSFAPGASAHTSFQCSDGVDNDSDGKVDYPADPGCSSADDASENSDAPPPKPQCSDGVDNDSDGKVDYPADPGCSSADDASESPDPGGSGSENGKIAFARTRSLVSSDIWTMNPDGSGQTNVTNNPPRALLGTSETTILTSLPTARRSPSVAQIAAMTSGR